MGTPSTVKSSRRLNHEGESDPVTVQIAGADPAMMAQAALDKGIDPDELSYEGSIEIIKSTQAGSVLLVPP